MDFAAKREELIALTKEKIALSVGTDILIIQTLATIDDLTVQINGFSKRLREWHGYFLPELDHTINDHEHFVSYVAEKSFAELTAEFGNGMQASIADKDYAPVQQLARTIASLFSQKEELATYLQSLTSTHMKNMDALAGSLIAARLLSSAGSLQRLSKLPASTIQMLGAEKALFRHLRTGSRSPKHGFLFNHPLVQQVKRDETGKVARSLADKLSICAKLDYFKGDFLAEQYLSELEAKWKR